VKTLSVDERFWDKVSLGHPGGCLVWGAKKTRNGYGQFSINRKHFGAHRISYELCVGTIPAGAHVLHKCDNRCCVNPDHLFLGTNTDNVRDREAKGRGGAISGEDHYLSKLTKEAVDEIRSSKGTGITQRQLAKKFNVTPPAISCVLRGITWK
jgi:hypothetical protein